MADLVFRFEEEKLPPAVVISTLVLAAIFHNFGISNSTNH